MKYLFSFKGLVNMSFQGINKRENFFSYLFRILNTLAGILPLKKKKKKKGKKAVLVDFSEK